MNKKGFIATSLILTFFLLFCAILLGVITNYNFNTNLIDKVKDKFSNDVKGFEDEKENGLEIDKIDTGTDVTIAAVIYKLNADGKTHTIDPKNVKFPSLDTDSRANQYKTTVTCTNKNGKKISGGTLMWNWTKGTWEFTLSKITEGSITCSIEFKEWRYPSPTDWYDAKYQFVEADGTTKTTTLLGALRENNPIYPPYGLDSEYCQDENSLCDPNQTLETIERTKPGEAASRFKEALMSFTEDDYGWSYYFRGYATSINNFVIFAGHCWRIVRVAGNGAIKLIYYSEGSCNNNSGYSVLPAAGSKTYQYSISRGNGSINYLYSNAYYNLKEWYDDTFNEKQKDMIADVIWCNDDSGQAKSRISDSNPNPTLKCNPYSDADANKAIKYTADDTVNGNGLLKVQSAAGTGTGYKYYKVGLLTADEAIFAGQRRRYNGLTYLQAKMIGSPTYSRTIYYTMTSAGDDTLNTDLKLLYYISSRSFDATEIVLSTMFTINSFDSLLAMYPNLTGYIDINGTTTKEQIGYRPMIALESDVKISNTDFTNIGSSSNPYVIEDA